MPVASDTARILGSLLWAAGVARARQCRLELGLDHRLDELTHPIAQPDFDRIKPIVEKRDRRLSLRLQGCRVRVIAGHGMVSTGAQNAGIVWVSAPGDYATFNSNHTPDGTPRRAARDKCRHRQGPRSRGSPDLRPHFCEAKLTSAYTAVRRAVARRSD